MKSVQNICAEDIEILFSSNGISSIFAESLADFIISLCCRSYITTSSIIRRLKKPKSTRPTCTFVPNFSDRIEDVCLPRQSFTEGIWISETVRIYSPRMVHIVPLIICFNIFNSVRLRLQFVTLENKQVQNYIKNLA